MSRHLHRQQASLPTSRPEVQTLQPVQRHHHHYQLLERQDKAQRLQLLEVKRRRHHLRKKPVEKGKQEHMQRLEQQGRHHQPKTQAPCQEDQQDQEPPLELLQGQRRQVAQQHPRRRRQHQAHRHHLHHQWEPMHLPRPLLEGNHHHPRSALVRRRRRRLQLADKHLHRQNPVTHLRQLEVKHHLLPPAVPVPHRPQQLEQAGSVPHPRLALAHHRHQVLAALLEPLLRVKVLAPEVPGVLHLQVPQQQELEGLVPLERPRPAVAPRDRATVWVRLSSLETRIPSAPGLRGS
ncbi:hypothetical protein PGQ11_002605 [Apiospora arundinis]|uniref:Uncharacterized protein n=1 Tax=Apiospora arundinis TaxID=335852 RepID=A0ABR2JIR1_9PEZI